MDGTTNTTGATPLTMQDGWYDMIADRMQDAAMEVDPGNWDCGALALETELYLSPALLCYVNWIWHPPGYDTEGDVCREPDGTFGRMCGGFLPNWFEAVEVSLYDEAKEEDVTVRYDRCRLVKLAEERNGFRSYGREECCYNEID